MVSFIYAWKGITKISHSRVSQLRHRVPSGARMELDGATMSIRRLVEFDKANSQIGQSHNQTCWTVLSVEDDTFYQQTLRLALKGLQVNGKSVELISANSAAEASLILSSRHDISVILLDVVMETDDAGLRLVDTIRSIVGNNRVRIILLTGQPGMAPHEDVMRQYDIDEYWIKTETTEEQLRSSVTSNVRTWHYLTELYNAKRSLQMLVDASRVITSKRDIKSFTRTVLSEIAKVIGVPSEGGIVCAHHSANKSLKESEVIAVSGRFQEHQGNLVEDILENPDFREKSEVLSLLEKAMLSREHCFSKGFSALYFSTEDVDKRAYIICVQTPNTLLPEYIALLKVFCENIHNGFKNLALFNRLSQLAYYDLELNAPNRNWLEREISQLDDETLSNSTLVLVDVKNYAETAVMLGKRYIRSLIHSFYEALSSEFPHASAICRIDDNQLALLFLDNIGVDSKKLARLTEKKIVIDGVQHTVLSTVGEMSLKQTVDYEASEIVTTAQIAVASTREKKLSYSNFDVKTTGEIAQRQLILHELYRAMTSTSELDIALQPKINMKNGKLIGAEALIRWVKPDGTTVPPVKFIPIAEASGLINKIDLIVLEKTMTAIEALSQHGLSIPVSFNVTCGELQNDGFVEEVVNSLNSSKIDPSLLEIEITETQAMEDYTIVNPILKNLRQRGIKISIDDFGTGYSSLAHITDLAATTLKLDKSFVSKLSGEDKEAGVAVCEMVLRLANRFDFDVIAEGVESEIERLALMDIGYEIAQGFYFAKPMALPKFIDWAKKRPQ